MTSIPLVSTIIPTFNRAHLVPEAIDSVLRQTYPNVEIIVVDDGSTDETQECLKRYGNRIKLIKQENAGPSAARNRGIAAAQGALIAFLDSDDLWLPEKLERQVRVMVAAGESVPCCLSNIMMHWRDKQISSFEIAGLKPGSPEGIWMNPDEVLATRFVLFNQGVVIRRQVVNALGGFDPSLRLLEDYEFALRLSHHRPWAFIRDPLVIWRESATSCYQDARHDDVRVQQLLVQILDGALSFSAQPGQSHNFHRLVFYELERARCQLQWNMLSHSGSGSMKAMAALLQAADRCLRALYRRSPWFPAMASETVVPQSRHLGTSGDWDRTNSQQALVRE